MSKQKESTVSAALPENEAPSTPQERCAEVQETSASESCSRDNEENKYMTFWYTEIDPTLGTQKPLLLVPGVRTHFPAHLRSSKQNYVDLEENIEFTVSPALPRGLTLDKATGSISGVPVAQQEVFPYQITVSIDVYAPSGIFLGKFPLATSAIRILIVDLKSLVVSPADVQNTEQIKLQWLSC
jgi:hypothetical protein